MAGSTRDGQAQERLLGAEWILLFLKDRERQARGGG